ncbi:MAG: hypothetical protein ABFS56_06405 [Pseudomonadota bacterium]
MKLKRGQQLLALFLTMSICGIAWAGDAKPKITITVQQTQGNLYLPSINEIHRNAKKAGITGKWGKLIRVQSKDYAAMKLPQRAFEVGKTLSDIAFVVLDSGDDDTPPSKAIIQQAYNALVSLKLPADIKAEIQTLKDQLETGRLKGEALRDKMDELISQVVPQIEQDKEPSIRDSGVLVLAAGYFKALYLGARTVASYPEPTPEQLDMFIWGELVDYFISHLTETATSEFKNSRTVDNFVGALKKIKPLVNKKRDEITKSDVKKIARALRLSFK